MANVILLVISLYSGVKIEELDVEKKVTDQPVTQSTK